MDLEKNGVFRNEFDEDAEDLLIIPSNFNISSLNIHSMLFKKKVLDSAIEAIIEPSAWFAIKTETENVNVCIKTNYPVFPGTYNMMCLLVISLAGAILGTGIYELKKIVAFQRNF